MRHEAMGEWRWITGPPQFVASIRGAGLHTTTLAALRTLLVAAWRILGRAGTTERLSLPVLVEE